MGKRYSVILGLVLILILGGFFVWRAFRMSQKPHAITQVNRALPKEVTIVLTKTGFSPSQVTVVAGTAVRWKNESGASQTVNSDNYPTNQLHRELNFGVFANESSVVYIFRTPGTFGYHNQFHPDQKGEIIVTK